MVANIAAPTSRLKTDQAFMTNFLRTQTEYTPHPAERWLNRRAESTGGCEASYPALRCTEPKQIARLDLAAVPIQLARCFVDPKEGQTLLRNSSNTLGPIVWTFCRDLQSAIRSLLLGRACP
jgi:hypothetical protein